MRHRAVQTFSRQVGDSIVRPATRATRQLTLITMLILLFTAPGALANSDAFRAAGAVIPEESAPPAALDPASVDGIPEAVRSDVGDARPSAASQELTIPRAQRSNLAALLAIRSSGNGSSTERTADEALADAIALGPRPELEPKNPFRKRKLDLFRTVHPVSIGNADLLVRFRVRGNMREVMRLDVRF